MKLLNPQLTKGKVEQVELNQVYALGFTVKKVILIEKILKKLKL